MQDSPVPGILNHGVSLKQNSLAIIIIMKKLNTSTTESSFSPVGIR